MPNEANTGTRAYVPGKQVTVAHLIAHPAPEVCEKAGIPDVDAIGILTLTPGSAGPASVPEWVRAGRCQQSDTLRASRLPGWGTPCRFQSGSGGHRLSAGPAR